MSALKIAVVTPTYNRALYLRQLCTYFLHQVAPAHTLRWFVLDDSPTPQTDGWCAGHPMIEYHYSSERIILGEKRNRLNDWAQHWGADIICSMDDDDWYGANYVADMTDLLLNSPLLFAGSGDDYYYDMRADRILKINAVRPMSSCNGVLCYKSSVLQYARYDATLGMGEEPSFIGKHPVLQHPNIGTVHIALAHEHNTATKKNYLNSPELFTDLTLEQMGVSDDACAFYRNLKNIT